MTIGGIPRAHAHYEGDLTMGDYFLQKGRETDALLCVMHEGVAVESLSQCLLYVLVGRSSGCPLFFPPTAGTILQRQDIGARLL